MPPLDPNNTGVARTQPYGAINGLVSRVLYASNASVTVNTTASETSLLSGVGFGSQTIPAAYLQAGTAIRITAQGILGTTGSTPTVTLKTYYGSTNIGTTGAVTILAGVTTPVAFKYETLILVNSIGTSGSLIGPQYMMLNHSAFHPWIAAASQAAATVDTTAAGNIDLKITWSASSASNTITVYDLIVEVIG